jgi:hypothetical protein
MRYTYLFSEPTYQVIKPQGDLEPESCQTVHHLGKSGKGVYYSSIKDAYRLQVWVLESCPHDKWVLEHDRHLNLVPNNGQQVYGSWILQDTNYIKKGYININSDDGTTVVQGNSEWNSDDENDDDEEKGNTKDLVDKFCGGIWIFGFHPFKEIFFLSMNLSRGQRTGISFKHLQDSTPW